LALKNKFASGEFRGYNASVRVEDARKRDMKQSDNSLTADEGGANATSDLSRQPSQVSCLDYRVVIEPTENGVFVATCPALLGCSSHGKTPAEALANIKEAMTEHLASLTAEDRPASLTFQQDRH